MSVIYHSASKTFHPPSSWNWAPAQLHSGRLLRRREELNPLPLVEAQP